MPTIPQIDTTFRVAGAASKLVEGVAPNPLTSKISDFADGVTDITGPLAGIDYYSRSQEPYHTGF
jgi:hypothetical protein